MNKGFAHIFLILLLGVIAVGGAYYLGTLNSTDIASILPSSPTNAPSTAVPTARKGFSDFQQYLSVNCEERANYMGLISLDKIPLDIDLDKVKATESRISEQGGLICGGWYGDEPLGVFLPYGGADSPKTYQIYDESARSTSLEGGYFGFGSLKKVVQDDEEYVVSIDFSWPHGGPATIGWLSVVGIVEKVIPYSDGNLYVNASERFIESDDPRLVNILSRYEDSVQSEEWDVPVFDSTRKEEAYSDIVEDFFSKENVTTKEWQVINQLKEQLEGFTNN